MSQPSSLLEKLENFIRYHKNFLHNDEASLHTAIMLKGKEGQKALDTFVWRLGVLLLKVL